MPTAHGPGWHIPALGVHAQASGRLSISLTIQLTVLFTIRLEPDTEPNTHLIENTQVTPISSASCGFATGLCNPSSGRAQPVAVAEQSRADMSPAAMDREAAQGTSPVHPARSSGPGWQVSTALV